MVSKYVKKPVVIDALEWTGKNLYDVRTFIEGVSPDISKNQSAGAWEEYERWVNESGLEIRTLEGKITASVGDFIIKGVKGEFYPCKPDIFNLTYEALKGEEGNQTTKEE